MKKLLIIALLFWGCDYAPTEHEHDTEHDHNTGHIHDTDHTHEGHYSCTDHAEYYPIVAGEIGDSLYYAIDTLTVIHAPNVSEADSICLAWQQYEISWMVDTTWCECEQGIPREF